MMALRRPALVGGGNGSSAPPAGSLGGVRCRSHGVRAGSAHVDRLVLVQALPRQRDFGRPPAL